MKLANIVDNVPYCPVCNIPLGKLTGNYDSVEHDGKRYVKFERFCDGRCRKKYVYFSDVEYNKTTRYIFNKDITIIRDDTKIKEKK